MVVNDSILRWTHGCAGQGENNQVRHFVGGQPPQPVRKILNGKVAHAFEVSVFPLRQFNMRGGQGDAPGRSLGRRIFRDVNADPVKVKRRQEVLACTSRACFEGITEFLRFLAERTIQLVLDHRVCRFDRPMVLIDGPSSRR